jgi:hypothetical protein
MSATRLVFACLCAVAVISGATVIAPAADSDDSAQISANPTAAGITLPP